MAAQTGQYYVRPMRASDLPEVSDVAARSFLTFWVYNRLFSHKIHEAHVWPDYRVFWLHSLKLVYYRRGGYGWVACRLVPTDSGSKEQIVGATLWIRHGTSVTAKAWQESHATWWDEAERRLNWLTFEVFQRIGNYGNAFDRQLNHSFEELCEGCIHRWDDLMPERWHLTMIMVDPDHQGKGLATQLLSWGLKHSTLEGVPCTLFSSQEAFNVYKKRGFFAIDWPNRDRVVDPDPRLVPWMVFEPDALRPELQSMRSYAQEGPEDSGKDQKDPR